MSPEELKHINDVCRLVHSRITYVPDRQTQGVPEHWQSHASRILESKLYMAKDDCDGFALTAAELLAIRGFDRSRLVLEFCQAVPDEYHLALTVRDPTGDWLIDNNYKMPVRVRHTNYSWHKMMRLSDLGNWKDYADGDQDLPS